MQALGHEAAPVWAQLQPSEARAVRAAMEQVGDDPVAASDAAEAFMRAARPNRAENRDPLGEGPAEPEVWNALSRLPGHVLAELLRQERASVTALILSRLTPEASAAMLAQLPSGQALAIMQSLLNDTSPSEAVIAALEAHFRRRLPFLREGGGQSGHERLARIFDRFDARVEAELLSALDGVEPGCGQKVRALMFTFDDLLRLDPAGMQTLLAATDRTTLTLALKGASGPALDAFLTNMTQRAGELLKEEISALGPVRRSEVEAARQEMLGIARQLVRRGDIRTGPAEDDITDELIE